MKTFKYLLLNIFLPLLFYASSYSQVITSIAPGASVPGKVLNVVIRASGTHFLNQLSIADFGQDITVLNFKVQNSETAVATIDVSANATIGFRNITITTNGETVTLPAGFEIFTVTGSFKATLEVLPVASVAISDFNVTDPATAPVFFFINIYNDNASRKLTVSLYLSAATRGLLGRIYKTNLTVNPNQYLKLSQKNFDQFERSPASLAFFNEVRGLGSFPPDDYTYRLEIKNEQGVVIGGDEVMTTVSNPKYNPELIYPGDNFMQEVSNIYSRFPLFQWYGQNDHFDFALYKVLPGQTPEEVVRNLYVFKQDDVIGNSFVYPVFAEALIDGQTYAWQVRGKYHGAKGIQYLPSEVFRFKYSRNLDKGDNRLAKINIIPQEIQLNPGQQFQFTANFLDVNGTPISNINHQWQLTPSRGTITSSGLFTAGYENATVAVLIKAGEVTDFATVTVKRPAIFFNQQDWNIEKLIRQIFGLNKNSQ